MDIPYEKQFHFRDGTSAGSLEALKSKLETIHYQEFYHHVNAEKNDFANWVRYVLHDPELAEELQRVSSIVETVEILDDHMHPRPIYASRADTQSLIEDNVLKIPLPITNNEKESPKVIDVQEAPSHVPHKSPEPLDISIIEEKLGLRSANAAHVVSKDTTITPKIVEEEKRVREELFGHELNSSTQRANTSQDVVESSKREHGPFAPRSADVDPDMTRLIVKDFIYGLIFGLILGMILGRIISM